MGKQVVQVSKLRVEFKGDVRDDLDWCELSGVTSTEHGFDQSEAIAQISEDSPGRIIFWQPLDGIAWGGDLEEFASGLRTLVAAGEQMKGGPCDGGAFPADPIALSHLESQLFSDTISDDIGGEVNGYTPDGQCCLLTNVLVNAFGPADRPMRIEIYAILDGSRPYAVDAVDFMAHLDSVVRSLRPEG